MTDQADRVPCDSESEEQVIGSALLDPERVIYAAAKNGITPSSFYVPNHALAWKTIIAEFVKQDFVDLVTVQRAVPGLNFHKIIDTITTVAHAEYHIKRVKDFYQRRTLVAAMRRAETKLLNVQEDTAEIMGEYEATYLSAMNTTDIQVRKIKDFREEKLSQWVKARDVGYVGVPCHIQQINSALGGWRQGCMSIIGAYRGVGKSTFIRSDAKFNAQAGRPVALFSLEDPGDIASACMVCDEADTSAITLDTGLATDQVLDHVGSIWKNIGDIPLYIVSSCCTIQQIVASATMLRLRHKIEAMYLDHIQYITPIQLPHMNRNETISTYSSALTAMAKRLNIAVICSSQFSRGPERDNREPRLSDLRDSGTLEQDARQVVLLFWSEEDQCFVANLAKNNYGRSQIKTLLNRHEGKRFEAKQEAVEVVDDL